MLRRTKREPPEVRQMIRALCSLSKAKREAALRDAVQLPPDTRLRLLEGLLARYDFLFALWPFVFIPLSFILFVVCGPIVFLPFWMFALIIGTATMALLRFPWVVRLARSLASLVELCPDTRFLPRLLNHAPNSKQGRGSEQDKTNLRRTLLKHLLPHLQPGEADNWTTEQRHNLIAYLLQPLEDMNLTLVILSVADRIHSPEMDEAVQKLTRLSKVSVTMQMPIGKAGTAYLEKVERIQQMAQNCLPEQILLRAAEAPSLSQPETLLRPASASATQTPQEQLLRPRSPE